MDRERISRLEALLARVQAAREQAAREHARADDAHPSSDHEELSPDDLEWAGKSEPPPAPPLADSPQISVPTRPAFTPMAASLEEAFEQYELDAETAEEVVEIAPDAEDDSVRPSVRPPIMIDAEFEAAAKIEADRAARSDDAYARCTRC